VRTRPGTTRAGGGHGDERQRTAEDMAKAEERRHNRGGVVHPGGGWEGPADGPGGVRQEGGVTGVQARVRNVGPCGPEGKGETQVEAPPA
jgi:hypothetical protein